MVRPKLDSRYEYFCNNFVRRKHMPDYLIFHFPVPLYYISILPQLFKVIKLHHNESTPENFIISTARHRPMLENPCHGVVDKKGCVWVGIFSRAFASKEVG